MGLASASSGIRPFGRPKAGAAVASSLRWNPSDKSSSVNLLGDRRGANVVQNFTPNFHRVRGNVGKSSGAHYFEFKFINDPSADNDHRVGLSPSSFALSSNTSLGNTLDTIGFAYNAWDLRQEGNEIANDSGNLGSRALDAAVGLGYNFATGALIVKTSTGVRTYTPSALSGTYFPTFSCAIGYAAAELLVESVLGVPSGYSYWTE